jgi:hypothetical protein
LKRLSRTTAIAAIAAATLLSVPLAASANPSEIYMSDACSPSFNVALNDPTICSRQGGRRSASSFSSWCRTSSPARGTSRRHR